jgi:hypothetical protein
MPFFAAKSRVILTYGIILPNLSGDVKLLVAFKLQIYLCFFPVQSKFWKILGF